jgi:hypothetical protein
MELTKQAVGKTTLPPAGPALVWQSKSLSQRLHLKEVMGGALASMSEAKLLHIEPPEAFCFPSNWWFMMQDANGAPASIVIPSTEWDELMSRIPIPKVIDQPINSNLIVDRVLVRTCKHVDGWHRECVMPKAETKCDNNQLVNAIVTGLLTPIVVWYVLRFVIKFLPSTSRESDYQNFGGSGDTTPKFSPRSILVLCLIAILTCAAFCIGSSMLIGFLLGATKCVHGWRETHVVTAATGFATALSIVISLLYLYQSAKEQVNREPNHVEPNKSSKLMLVEVPDGGSHAVVRNPNIFDSGAMVHGPSRIAMGTH